AICATRARATGSRSTTRRLEREQFGGCGIMGCACASSAGGSSPRWQCLAGWSISSFPQNLIITLDSCIRELYNCGIHGGHPEAGVPRNARENGYCVIPARDRAGVASDLEPESESTTVGWCERWSFVGGAVAVFPLALSLVTVGDQP